jgi:hypothetical protein
MQSIPIPQIDRRHTDPLPTLIPFVIRFNLFHPIVAHILGAILAKPDIDEEVGVVFTGAEVGGRRLAAEFFVDRFSE